MDALRIGLLGTGTVGGGVIRILATAGDEIARRLGRRVEITHAACRHPESMDEARRKELGGAQLHSDPMEVVEADDVDIVAELIGGEDVALRLIKRALERGRPVVTANKALIAQHGDEVFALARERGVCVAYEASVMGGVPIIQVLRESMSANRLQRVVGIINGTCNYILTKMRTENMEYADALSEAQKLGYAEADPTLDIEGIDAAHKLAIMAAISFGTPLSYPAVFTEGITAVRGVDVRYAEEFGYRIRHLGVARLGEAGLELRAHPALIPSQHLLASVDGVMNAVEVVGDAVGPTLYCGAGAGSGPTASAVVSDMLEVARTMAAPVESRTPALAFQADAVRELPIAPISELKTACYVRMMVKDKAGVLSSLSAILAKHDISIRSVSQHEDADAGGKVPLIFMTHETGDENLSRALDEAALENDIASDILRLRVENLS